MLNMTKSTISRSVERPVAEGALIEAEGAALVGKIVSGTFGVAQSTGAAGEKFAGINMSQIMNVDFLPFVVEFTVPASGDTVVSLPHTPIGGSVRVVVDNTPLSSGDPATVAGEFSIDGKDVTVHTSLAGKFGRVVYRYAPTVIEVQAMQGDPAPGAGAASILGSTGVIEAGDVYTSEFDTAADWSGEAPQVRLGPNGMFTTSGSGTIVNAMVIQLPSVEDPLLGLRISV